MADLKDLKPTYAFEGDLVLAFHEGRKIASGTVFSAVEKDALEYLESLAKEKKETAKKTATHIVSPSGLEGTIISRINTVWGEDITVRFANGEIRTLETHGGDPSIQYFSKQTKVASGGPIVELKAALDADCAGDHRSLAARLNELDRIAKTAETLIVGGVSYADEHDLDQIRLAADFEQREVKDAIEHLNASDAEAFVPPAPFTMGVAEQADMGRAHGDSWLDNTANEMIAESEKQDFEKILDEEPALFATELETGTLADQGSTREMAYAHIVAKTAGFAGDDVDEYRQAFVARVELARRAELATRKDTLQKEATAKHEELDSGTDEALFL